MAENIQRSVGRPQEYKFDRGGMPAEMGPYIGIVVNNVDNTRSGRLQVWIEQFGATNADGSPNLTDPSVWRTVRYCPPFYGATPQTGNSGAGTYPGNRNSYGMWFTPPDLGTRVMCFFVGGDPTVGGYYIGCIPEDGINHMIPAIGASTNYQPNNAKQQQLLSDVPLAPVTEINDISTQVSDNPRFFDQKKPVQSSVEAVFFQQGLERDPVRGPIRSSSQRESPSNCYGIATPGKPIYQGGYTDPAKFKAALEKGQIKLQDVAVIGRQGGHTFVMDDGDIDGKDTLIRIRTAKGHQITMSDDGDAFFITHANGQTWIELGKQGTVDVFSTNSINLRSQGVLNFHADKGINMYSGGSIKIKSEKTTLVDSNGSLLMNSAKYSLLSGQATVGISSTGALAMKSQGGSWDAGSSLNFKASVINLNGAATRPVSAFPANPNFKLADTEFNGSAWVVKPNSLDTIVTRAPTHQPYAGAGKGADVSVNLNPIEVQTPDVAANTVYEKASARPITNGLTWEKFAGEPDPAESVGPFSTTQVKALTAQTAQDIANIYPAYDDDGNLMPGFELNENNDPVYTGAELGERGVGVYGQSLPSLVSAGWLKSTALDLVKSGVSVESILKSAASWTGQNGVGSLLDYLNNPLLQNITQIGLMAASFFGLTQSGVINGDESPRYIATFLQPATEYGVDEVIAWVDNSVDTQTYVNLSVSGRQGQYAMDFVDAYNETINFDSTVVEAATTTETTQREALDQVVAEIIGNPKVSVPQYTDIPTVIKDTVSDAGTVPADVPGVAGSLLVNVVANAVPGDGTFRFAPGNKQG